jgi:hypothetical protein
VFNATVRASKKLHYETKFKQYAKNPKKTWDLLYELTNGNKKKVEISNLLVDGNNINQPETIANVFNKFFATAGKNVAESVPRSNVNPTTYLPYSNVPDLEFDRISSAHVSDIIKSFPNKSSVDLDGISLKLLKYVKFEIREPLAHIFNLSLESGQFPTRLKNSRTVPIFKAGDPTVCDNYRPISLISTFSKIIEKIVATNLTNHLQLNKLLHKNQYGFQRNMSTEHNLIQVVNYIGNALNKGNYCIGIFLDLRKAFDSCSHDILLKKLEKLGLRGNVLAWFDSYLKNRMQQVDINGSLSSTLEILFGVLQGSNLGPLLFLCYINDIFNATDLATFLFADDTSCLAEHKNLDELVLYVNTELRKLANWFRSNRMAVNISKTNFMIFHSKGKIVELDGLNVTFDCNELNTQSYDPNLKFNLERIHDRHIDPKMQSFKLLGVYFDENLTFNKHASNVCAKLTRSIFCMKRASNYLSLKSLRSLYFALVHSHLLYCPIIINCMSQTNLNSIAKLQKRAIRVMSKSAYNAHTEPIFLQNKILPFDKLILQSKLLFMHSVDYKYAPQSFENTWIKNNTRDMDYDLRNREEYSVPFIRIELFRRNPLCSLPTAWNELCDEIRFQHNRTTFKIALSDYLFGQLVAA